MVKKQHALSDEKAHQEPLFLVMCMKWTNNIIYNKMQG